MSEEIDKELETAGGIEAQLDMLYAEKEMLDKELGFSEPTQIIEAVRSLEEQLNDLYQEKEERAEMSLQHNGIEIQIEGDKLIVYGPKSIQVKKRKIS